MNTELYHLHTVLSACDSAVSVSGGAMEYFVNRETLVTAGVPSASITSGMRACLKLGALRAKHSAQAFE